MKPFIDSSFWSDPDVEGSKPGVKLAALWLITNSQTNLLGVCGASPARFEFETGLKPKALESAIQALPRAFKRFGGVVFVTRYIRHQFGHGEKLMRNNFFVALKSLFEGVEDSDLRAFILKEYPEFSKPSKGLTKPKDGKEGKGDGSRNGKEGAGREGMADDPIAVRLGALFNRRPDTAWGEDEAKAYRKIPPISEDDFVKLERYYKAERAKGDDGIHRRDLATFLNNFSGELDRARAHKPFSGVTKNTIDDGQWRRFLTSIQRDYEDPMRAMPFLRDDFSKWLRLQ